MFEEESIFLSMVNSAFIFVSCWGNSTKPEIQQRQITTLTAFTMAKLNAVMSSEGWKSISHKTTSGKTPSKLAILFHVKPSDFRFVTWFMSFSSLIFHNCSLKFSKQKLSYFEPFQSLPKEIKTLKFIIEANMSKKPWAKLPFRKWSGH